MLLLRGWRSRASRFSALIPGLVALGLSPVAFDAPGHGDSEGTGATLTDYCDVIDHLQLRYGKFHTIIGHSFGVLSAFTSLGGSATADRLVAIAGVSNFQFLVDGMLTSTIPSSARPRSWSGNAWR